MHAGRHACMHACDATPNTRPLCAYKYMITQIQQYEYQSGVFYRVYEYHFHMYVYVSTSFLCTAVVVYGVLSHHHDCCHDFVTTRPVSHRRHQSVVPAAVHVCVADVHPSIMNS